MLKELEEFIQNNQDDIIVTGGIRSVYKELHADHETGAADNK